MSLIKMMLVMVSVAAISKTFGLLRGKDTRDYLAAAFPELNAWERAGADASSAGMVAAEFENQKELLKCNWTIRKRLPRCKMRLKKRLLAFSRRLHARI